MPSLAILNIAFILILSTTSFAQDITRGRTIYEEEDGSPSGAYWKIKVSNDKLTENADYSGSIDISAGSGDVTDVGDCASGACFDGTSDGGTYIKFYDPQGAGTLITGNIAGAVTWTLPATGGTLIHTETDPTVDSSAEIQAIIGAGVYEASDTNIIKAAEIDTYSELNTIVADVTLTHNGLIDTFAELDAIVADKALVNKADGAVWLGVHDFGGATTLEIWNGTADATLAVAGQMNLNTTDEQLSFHSAADGEISGEASISLLRHIVATFDPAGYYDQETTYRVLPLFQVGDDSPEGITITEWSMVYVGGNPTTEIDCDLMCDTTPDYNPAAGATVMDVLDTTTGSSTADTGFDSATCANGAYIYLRLGADPTDANVVTTFNLWFYNEED